MKIFKKVSVFCLLISMLFNLTATISIAANKTPASKITLNKSSLTLVVGKTAVLTAKTNPSKMKKNVKWKSNNRSIVTVSKGKLTAKKAGKTTVTAYIGKKRLTT